jgi:hypothetical protein
VVLYVCALAAPAHAARPLLDSGKWDQYFALFARNTQVPWKPITIRLDTYSGAPVDFAAYEVDPAEVLVAGANARPRPIETAHRASVAKWRFAPPQGLAFVSSDVTVPLNGREGFFVVEARRGDAAQQVWLNLSRVGLVSKETASGITLFGADLGTGKAFAGMRLTYLVNASFTYGKTDATGVARVPVGPGSPRPRFVIAEWGQSKAFLSFLSPSPVPNTVVGIRVERAVVRAGEHVRAIGFVRRRSGSAMRPASGEVHVSAVASGKTLATAVPRLDAAGAFTADLVIPAGTAAGEVALLASADHVTGGATVHVDAVADVDLTVAATCGNACPANADVPVVVTAKRGALPVADRDVRVRVVRAPHVLAPGTPEDAPTWAATTTLDALLHTNAQGSAFFTLPPPTDGLASTYGIDASSGGSTASARVVTPTAKTALTVRVERADINIGEPATVNVRGFDALDGTPVAGLAVRVRVSHGPNVQESAVKLDAEGRGRVTFTNVSPGTNIITAQADVGGTTVLDADAITVNADALAAGSNHSADVTIALDRARYRVGDRVNVDASLDGAVGDAYLTFEGANLFATQTVPVRGGHAMSSFTVPQAVGAMSIGVAFVRDGATYFGTQRITVDGPGYERAMTLAADKTTYASNDPATVTISDGDSHGAATIAVRLADGNAARGAVFADAPAVLATVGATSQVPASGDPAWHAGIAPARSTVGDIFGSDRALVGQRAAAALAASSPAALVWRVERIDGATFTLQLPSQPGRYVLSVLKIADNGAVGAASLSLDVR